MDLPIRLLVALARDRFLLLPIACLARTACGACLSPHRTVWLNRDVPKFFVDAPADWMPAIKQPLAPKG